MKDPLKAGNAGAAIRSGIPTATPKNAADTSCRGIYNMYANKDLAREPHETRLEHYELAEALTKVEEQGNIMSNHQRKVLLIYKRKESPVKIRSMQIKKTTN